MADHDYSTTVSNHNNYYNYYSHFIQCLKHEEWSFVGEILLGMKYSESGASESLKDKPDITVDCGVMGGQLQVRAQVTHATNNSVLAGVCIIISSLSIIIIIFLSDCCIVMITGSCCWRCRVSQRRDKEGFQFFCQMVRPSIINNIFGDHIIE